MNVGELHDALENYRNDLPVVLVIEDPKSRVAFMVGNPHRLNGSVAVEESHGTKVVAIQLGIEYRGES